MSDDEVMWAQSGTGDDFQCVHVDAWREAQAEIAKLRDIIARRLACDGSNGVWDARKNYELTEEMRAAVSPSPVTDATAIISADESKND